MTRRRGVLQLPKMPKFQLIDGRPDASAAGQVRKRVRESARDWPKCPRCGGRETITASVGNVKNKLCVVCLMGGRRVVVE